jgi:hypothetical protein
MEELSKGIDEIESNIEDRIFKDMEEILFRSIKSK